ncbi:hypothetical protein DVH24_022918 [Malus domestica]|uniref:BUB1 N-terminal domain-containing protein n=1 Tax=Malus domestica TaxID=3750 RepID=A0A498KQN9_MALDO|nr:hypothetical protein DVH24_022918 [Malus domestica]
MSNNDLLTSLISDIKTYSGKDPLLPWLRGIRKMNDSLPPRTLKEKLPRFLQKCAQTFESDRRYRKDLRYIRVWLKLMDFVDDPRALLRTMVVNQIGTKHSLFYRAYALYYEKNKKFEEAEKMYHLGVQNLAEPIGALEKSYEQFLQRMERHRRHRNQEKRTTTKRPLLDRTIPPNGERSKENACRIGARPIESQHDPSRSKRQVTSGRGSEEPKMFGGDDTVVVKFVDTAIVGKSEAEDACHHGLVDPTINMKEAMSAINDMFREPIETAPISRRPRQSQPKNNNVDSVDARYLLMTTWIMEGNQKIIRKMSRTATQQSHQEPLNIFIDDDNDSPDQSGVQNPTDDSTSPASHRNVFVFPKPKDLPGESSSDLDVGGSSRPRFREDTMVCRFVGATISDEPEEVENACHHGLVDPTINLKEAMDDINNMFGKPMDFVRKRRVKKQDRGIDRKEDFGGFSILPDDNLDQNARFVGRIKRFGFVRGHCNNKGGHG